MPSEIKYELKSLDFTFNTDRNGTAKIEFYPHLHRELELVCLWEGETVACADSAKCTLHAGDIFLSFPNQIHYYETKQPERFVILMVKPDLMPELAEVFESGVPVSPVLRGALEQPRIRFLVEALVDVREEKSNPFEKIQRRGYLLALFSELLRQMPIEQLPVGDSGAVRSIVAFCTKNYAENLSLSLLEEKLHLNKYYISHLFSGKLGMRFNDYVNFLRVSEACKLLTYSEESITDISTRVGFNTLRTFNRAFQKQTGTSPSEFKREAQRQASAAAAPAVPKRTAVRTPHADGESD